MRHLLVLAALTAPFGLATANAFADEIPAYDTGVDDSHVVLAPGSTDPHWSVVQTPSGSGFRAPGQAYVAAPHPQYLPNTPPGAVGSSWIGIWPDLRQVSVNGDFVYRTTFDMSGLDPATASLTAQIASDDQVVAVRFNGATTGHTAAGFVGFDLPFTLTGGFTSGVNTLEIVVRNAGFGSSPSGLRVRLDGTAEKADKDPPVLSGVADRAVEFEGKAATLAAEALGISATDVIDGTVTVVLTPSVVELGTHEVVATATDKAGNSVSAAFMVTVADTIAPVITSLTANAAAAVETSAAVQTTDSKKDKGRKDKKKGEKEKSVSYEIAGTATDAGDPAPRFRIVSVRVNGKKAKKDDARITGDLSIELSTKKKSSYTITVECVDAAGNTSTGTLDVNPNDATPPAGEPGDDWDAEGDDGDDDGHHCRGGRGQHWGWGRGHGYEHRHDHDADDDEDGEDDSDDDDRHGRDHDHDRDDDRRHGGRRDRD